MNASPSDKKHPAIFSSPSESNTDGRKTNVKVVALSGFSIGFTEENRDVLVT